MTAFFISERFSRVSAHPTVCPNRRCYLHPHPCRPCHPVPRRLVSSASSSSSPFLSPLTLSLLSPFPFSPSLLCPTRRPGDQRLLPGGTIHPVGSERFVSVCGSDTGAFVGWTSVHQCFVASSTPATDTITRLRGHHRQRETDRQHHETSLHAEASAHVSANAR